MMGEDRLEIRRRVIAGETFEQAAVVIGCSKKSIQRLLVKTGGVAPRARLRSPMCLSLQEREEVLRGVHAGESMRAIARRLGRAASTVSRDVATGGRRKYRAWRAEEGAARRARRPKHSKLAASSPLRDEVEQGLAQRWSPQQIAARLRSDFPEPPHMRVSHETIYRSLLVQMRGALRKEFAACLRTGRTQRRPSKRNDVGGQSRAIVMLSQRPPESEDRAVVGHWEGDLIIGKAGKSAVGTLVERYSRYLMLLELPHGRTAERVREALTVQIQRLPEHLRRSLMWDQGKEMAEHAHFTIDTQVQVYFCDPHSPWQRGSNENTNGLLRQYLPKGVDLSAFSGKQLDAIAHELNGRPRQTLAWRTPAEVFASAVATTA
ncbi:IS30 family transposase [Corallococcus coralloides]|nr:IS30 family transposase [Corallococcus coralloides]